MRQPTEEKIQGMLIGIISDGFNRSIGALAEAGAIDTTKLNRHYIGVGSKYYDLVTEQIVLTAKYCAPGIRQLFEEHGAAPIVTPNSSEFANDCVRLWIEQESSIHLKAASPHNDPVELTAMEAREISAALFEAAGQLKSLDSPSTNT
jgi:hypothetical protein